MNDRASLAARSAPVPGAGALEREPLAVRGRFERDPAWVPLDRLAAKQPGPEAGQAYRIGAVQHDLAYPADRGLAVVAHQPMMDQGGRAVVAHQPMMDRRRPSSGHAVSGSRHRWAMAGVPTPWRAAMSRIAAARRSGCSLVVRWPPGKLRTSAWGTRSRVAAICRCS